MAKSYAVACMDMRKTEICLGQDAIELQKKAALERQKALKEEFDRIHTEWEAIGEKLRMLVTVENLTSFHRISKEDCAYFYLAGYHNSVKQTLHSGALKKRHRDFVFSDAYGNG